MTSYFERNGARSCTEGENPAVWLLNVIGDTPNSTTTIDWSTRWDESVEKAEVEHYIESLLSHRSEKRELKNDEYAASFQQQLFLVTYRLFQQYWRDPTYLYSKFAVCISAVCL